MKKYLSMLVALMATLWTVSSFAYTPPPAPPNGWYVSDQAGKMSADQITQLNQKVEQVSKTTKNEFGILLLQDMGGENIEDVAHATFNAWGIGKRGLDNGCLIVVAIKERKSRIETGKGVGGEVTDLQANAILKKNLNPHLKTGDFAGGFSETLDALSSLIESRHNQKADPAPTPQASSGCDVVGPGATENGFGLTMAAIIIGAVAFMLGLRAYARSRSRKETERLRQVEAELATENEGRAEMSRIAEEQRAKRMEDEARRRAAEVARQRSAEVEKRRTNPPPPLPRVPIATRSSVPPPLPVKKIAVPAAVAAVATATVLEAERTRRAQEEEQERRRRRDREEEDRRRREREEEDDRRQKNSSSSSSSFDWGGGSSSGSDSGGGFGGGDSGGGGSSSDW